MNFYKFFIFYALLYIIFLLKLLKGRFIIIFLHAFKYSKPFKNFYF